MQTERPDVGVVFEEQGDVCCPFVRHVRVAEVELLQVTEQVGGGPRGRGVPLVQRVVLPQGRLRLAPLVLIKLNVQQAVHQVTDALVANRVALETGEIEREKCFI